MPHAFHARNSINYRSAFFKILFSSISAHVNRGKTITTDISANLVDYQGAFLRAERAKASVFAAIRAIGQRRLNFLLLV